jgi:hypothetical protein
MRRWFLSYNSQGTALMESLEAALRRKDPEAKIFFAPKNLRGWGSVPVCIKLKSKSSQSNLRTPQTSLSSICSSR